MNEIARCLNVPFNIAAGNSSGYNYASGRLDFQAFDKSISVDQNTIEIEALDRVFVIWLEQYFSARGIRGPVPAHQWFLDGLEHVDPAKEANAQATRLANHTTNLAIECGKAGRDWEEVLRQAARERDVMQELELIPGGWVMPPGGYIPEDGEGAAESGADTDEDETGEGEK